MSNVIPFDPTKRSRLTGDNPSEANRDHLPTMVIVRYAYDAKRGLELVTECYSIACFGQEGDRVFVSGISRNLPCRRQGSHRELLVDPNNRGLKTFSAVFEQDFAAEWVRGDKWIRLKTATPDAWLREIIDVIMEQTDG